MNEQASRIKVGAAMRGPSARCTRSHARQTLLTTLHAARSTRWAAEQFGSIEINERAGREL